MKELNLLASVNVHTQAAIFACRNIFPCSVHIQGALQGNILLLNDTLNYGIFVLYLYPRGSKNGWRVFYHFVGAVPGSTELRLLLHRILIEVADISVCFKLYI